MRLVLTSVCTEVMQRSKFNSFLSLWALRICRCKLQHIKVTWMHFQLTEIYMCIYVHLNEQAEEAHDQMHISKQLNATKHTY